MEKIPRRAGHKDESPSIFITVLRNTVLNKTDLLTATVRTRPHKTQDMTTLATISFGDAPNRIVTVDVSTVGSFC